MGTSKRVLMTGHQGYIGSVMAPLFLRSGHDVVGFDTGYFRECTLVDDPVTVPELRRDIRDVKVDDLRGFDAVVHLAALSNDPIGNLNNQWTREINLEGSVHLARLAREAGVERFLFSSSCIMYGMSEAAEVDEESPLAPRTEYARSKVEAEKALGELASDDFSPVFLRNGTVYGLSPRMRFDTVLNDLTARAVTTGKVTVLSNGLPWRPVVHVEDVSRAFLAVLEAPRELIHNQAFNTGAGYLNKRIIDLARVVASAVPGSMLEVQGSSDADQRTYKADFSKFARVFPDFQFSWTPEDGARQLYEDFQRIGLNYEKYVDQRYTRLKWLRTLIDEHRLDAALRWNGNYN
ncbi:MAG TPA: SDR family oxidoreductase [Acidobacteriota bacterium]|nr:SDR family oxidoreductase [Acidobacteriota bacterium]